MRQLRRLSSITKSPIFSHFNETISGSSVIRTFKAEKNFINSMDKKIDENLRFYNADLISNRFFSIFNKILKFDLLLFKFVFKDGFQ